MGRSKAIARVLADGRLECRVTAPDGETLVLTGVASDIDPTVDGANVDLSSNPALVHNAWAYAKFTHLSVTLPSRAEQENAGRRAAAHRNTAEWIADVACNLAPDGPEAWCSGCFGRRVHRKAVRPLGHLPAYVCTFCGTPTLPCAGPRCTNMAVRGRGAVRVPRYCAEHRHEIPGFEKAEERIGALENYEDFLAFEKPNLGTGTKVVGTALAAVPLLAGAAFVAAPAIGGLVGSMIGGYSGAAATSYGLALLGGGSIASGGLGMAGGTVVITALGGALGGAMGASVANEYVREDKSFHIELLKGGTGIPVVVCSGFLSQSDRGWGQWKDLVTRRYPDSPVYRVHWGAKELKHLGFLAGGGSAKFAAANAARDAAAKAAKWDAKKLGPLGPVLLAADLAKNPWLVAKNRAEKTGVIVADLLARTDADSYVLVGHSLGARAMVVAIQTLSSKRSGKASLDPPAPTIREAHLLGAAVGAKSDWTSLAHGIDDAVFNYYSANDDVLGILYRAAQAGQTAAGRSGFTPETEKVRNLDVSSTVGGHTEYLTRVELR